MHASRGSIDDSDFVRLVERELAPLSEHERKQMQGKRWLEQPPRNLFGLALSGGGIRSATFNLGLLQGLNEIGMLRGMDYLGTVSGGGYTGGFWTRWRAKGRRDARSEGPIFPQLDPSSIKRTKVDESLRSGDEPAEIRHLRKFSRFLAPAFGLFTFDTGRMLVTAINAIVPSILGAAAFLISAVVLSIIIGAWVLVLPGAMELLAPTVFGEHARMHLGAMITMLGFGAAHLGVMDQLWQDQSHRPRARTIVAILQLILLSVSWGLIVAWRSGSTSLPLLALQWAGAVVASKGPEFVVRPGEFWLYVAMPAVLLLSVSVVNALVRPAAEEASMGFRTVGREEGDRVASWLAFAGIVWALVTFLWAIAGYLHQRLGGLELLPSLPIATLVAFLSRFVGRPSPGGERIWQRVARLGLSVIAWLVLLAFVLAAMLALLAAQHHAVLGVLMLGTGLAVAYIWFAYDTNRVGFHHFYRARIVRSFLGAGVMRGIDADDASEVQPDDDIDLASIGVAQPLHLVVCAANSLRPANPLTDYSRGAESAVLSPVGFSVGTSWTTWHATRLDGVADDRHGPTSRYTNVPTLGAALTASAAAFNTQMGAKSKALGPAVSFLMTMFGLRLGLWLRHPDRLNNTHPVVRNKVGGGFFAELLGQSDARNDDWVFLSDGGHFDNTALYELVRRHCRYVIVSDCGQDADRAFDDLGAVVRRARADFDVDIRVNLEPLKPDAMGCSRQPMVAGDIHYPNGDTGIILVFKPTIVGTEPPDILQYRARNKLFPHQSTGDQFFDEAQWESYRRLGQHAARIAFAATTDRDRHPSLSRGETPLVDLRDLDVLRGRMAQEFSAARRAWFSRPPDYGARIDRIAHQLAALDSLLAGSGTRLIREVSWELDAGPLPPDAPPPAPMTQDESALAISTIHQALVTCEAIFLREDLAAHFNQPMYVGVMNLMARWMQAPMVRAWWPLMRATCTEAFRTFAESQFQLGTATAQISMPEAEVGADVLPLATRVKRQSGASLATTHLHLVLTLRDAESLPGTAPLVPGRVEVARLDADVSPDDAIMIWLGRDLLVPPGLWGMGLGSGLLARMSDTGGTAESSTNRAARDARHREQIVIIRTVRAGSTGAKKDSADLQHLYVRAGFETAPPSQLAARFPRSFFAAYARLHERCGTTESYLPAPAAIASLSDNADFVVLWRPVASSLRR